MPDDVRILVLVTTRASPDGAAVHRYLAGQVYGPETDPRMSADLAAVFVREGWGEAIEDVEGGSRVHAHAAREAPVEPEPAAACLWCGAPYTARSGRGGPVQRFCSDACRAAFHRGARRWAARELEAGRLDITDLRNA